MILTCSLIYAVNLRFTFEPAVVVFPASAKQVSEVIKAGDTFGLQVVARSGGVSFTSSLLSSL